MTKSEAALAKVQNLYVMQVHLWNVLDAKNLTPAQRNEARRQLREFASLLRSADWKVMGGEDVYAALKGIEHEAKRKLAARARVTQKSSIQRKAIRKQKVKKHGRSRKR